ncbi:MAG TPA: hypothetical protein VFZ78_10325 [Flavisolibacter sp.]
MKQSKLLFVAALLLASTLTLSCGNNQGESGSVDDGTGIIDSNGALADTMRGAPGSVTDTAAMEDRMDTEKRDTVNR